MSKTDIYIPISKVLFVRLTDAFEKKDEEPAVECEANELREGYIIA